MRFRWRSRRCRRIGVGQLAAAADAWSCPLPITIVAVLAISLATAQALAFTPQQTDSWICHLCHPGVLEPGLDPRLPPAPLHRLGTGWPSRSLRPWRGGAVRRPPQGNARRRSRRRAPSLLGLTARVAAIVPAPVVFAVVAASVLPFVVGLFDAMGRSRW